MPLPDNPEVVETSHNLVTTLKGIFGTPQGFRPAHAKGILLSGNFTPTPTASTLSAAPHFSAPQTPILIRFSNSTGIPTIPDTDSNADPRGMAVRFLLDGPHVHTDIVAHSTPFFPTRTGAGFLDFLNALKSGPEATGEFIKAHPSVAAFVKAPKPAPISYAREEYFGVTAFKLVSGDGKGTFVRYHIVPEMGVETIDEAKVKELSPEYLQDEVKQRIAKGENFAFKLLVQIAQDEDVTDDATIHWPADRKVVELGRVEVQKLVDDGMEASRKLIFDPIPRVKGVEPSADPLLDVRAAVYLLSGRERRAATGVGKSAATAVGH